MSEEQRDAIIATRIGEFISCRKGLKKLRSDAALYRSALAQAIDALKMSENDGWITAPLTMQRAIGIYPSPDSLLQVTQQIKTERERLSILEAELKNSGIVLKEDQD